jgi:hypothetical protein
MIDFKNLKPISIVKKYQQFRIDNLKKKTANEAKILQNFFFQSDKNEACETLLSKVLPSSTVVFSLRGLPRLRFTSGMAGIIGGAFDVDGRSPSMST